MTARRSKGTEREALVVAAAAEVIAEQGLVDLRIRDVADRAGMTVGHVTYYFPSKNELLIRAIRHSELSFHQAVEQRLARLRDPWSRLRALIDAASASGPGDPGWVLWFQVWSIAASDPDVAVVQRELAGWWRSKLAEVVDYGVERGAFGAADAKRAVAVISALTDGLSVQLALGDGTLTRAAVRRLVMATASDLLQLG